MGRVWRSGGDIDGGWVEVEGWDWCKEGRRVEAWEVRGEGGSEGKCGEEDGLRELRCECRGGGNCESGGGRGEGVEGEIWKVDG